MQYVFIALSALIGSLIGTMGGERITRYLQGVAEARAEGQSRGGPGAHVRAIAAAGSRGTAAAKGGELR
jgi:hypothetical protein